MDDCSIDIIINYDMLKLALLIYQETTAVAVGPIAAPGPAETNCTWSTCSYNILQPWGRWVVLWPSTRLSIIFFQAIIQQPQDGAWRTVTLSNIANPHVVFRHVSTQQNGLIPHCKLSTSGCLSNFWSLVIFLSVKFSIEMLRM